MDSASGRALSAAPWQIGAQAVMSLLQLAYAAVTARVFTPTQFGAFAVALSLLGILSAAGASGLVSYAIREPRITRDHLQSLRIVGALTSMGLGASYWLLLGPWAAILGARSSESFRWPLTLSLILTSYVSIESALLRRQNRVRADAVSLATSYFVGVIVGLLVISRYAEPWALAANLVATPIALICLVLLVRRRPVYDDDGPASDVRRMANFAALVMRQNATFVLLTQLPIWAIGRLSDSSTLGHYSRASTFAGIPGLSLGNALVRSFQPNWLIESDRQDYIRQMRSAVLTVSVLALPLFSSFSCVGPWLVSILLGPAWTEAGLMVQPIALGAGFAVVFAVCASGAEMRAEFSAVRRAQLSMVIVVSAFGLVLASTHSIVASVWLLSLQHAVALIVLWRTLSRDPASGTNVRLTKPFSLVATATGAAWLAGYGGAQLVDDLLRAGIPPPLASLCCVTTGVLAHATVLLLVARTRPARRLLATSSFSVLHRLPPLAKILGLAM